ncbi:MAG: class I SAM-dependent methyltransferase [Planctomycetes bacterium]|nr:class I SAM-dependent methyltransferase [Planctomycetota bacterium]
MGVLPPDADGRTLNDPLDEHVLERLLGLVEADAQGCVLDVGCGRGAMLERILARLPCRAIGVDPRDDELRRARERLLRFGTRVTLHAARWDELAPRPAAGSLDAAVCVGASHAFADGRDALPAACAALGALLRPGGLLLLGEGFWRRTPDPEYLAATGMHADELRAHAENVAVGEAAGLVPLAAVTSSEQAFDLFESAFWTEAETALARAPDDPAARARAEHVRRWRDAYLRWGRVTMGFALYVFRAPG